MIQKPKPTGRYAVGTFTYTVYNDRDEILFPGTKRSIPARVYYPVLKGSVEGKTKAQYMSRSVVEGLRKFMKAPLNYDKLESSGDNFSECFTDAPVIGGEKFPLILFSHGLCSYREANSFLCIELSSQGYVVISVGHPYDANCSELDDGSVIFLMKDIVKKQYDPLPEAAFKVIKLTRSKGTDRELADQFEELQQKYCRQAIVRIEEWKKDSLAALRYAKENLKDLIDFDKGVGAAGHSFGGATAFALCLDEDEIVCGANIDGALFGNNKGKTLDKPFLQMSCKNNMKAETRPYIDHRKPVYQAVFEKMKHVGFSDMKHLMPSPMKGTMGSLDPDLMHETLSRLHLEFFDAYLKKTKDCPALESSEAVTVTVHQPDIKD